jgi:hypothetical protein
MGPDSADWQRRWTVDAGSVLLQPVTRRFAQDVLERQGFHLTGTLPDTDQVRYSLSLR